MSEKVYWLGVSFDPDEDIDESAYLTGQQEHIARFLDECILTISSQGGNIYVATYQNPDVFKSADIIDVWYEDKARIGFGFLVRDVGGIRDTKPAMRPWFKSIGITMYVALYEIDPKDAQQRKPRPFGIDEMVSADII